MLQPLTAAAFAPFGDVIAADTAAEVFTINDGTATRYHDLSRVRVLDEAGQAGVSRCHCQPASLPMVIRMMESHPLGSQAFVPLDGARFAVVVAAAGEAPPHPEELRGFITDGSQGVTYAPGVWHHPMLALERPADFLMVDRIGPGENLQTCRLAEPCRIVAGPD